MTKDQLLQLVSKAYDDGADIDIRFHVSESEAGELADQYSEHFDTPTDPGGSGTTGWHRLRTEDYRVNLTTYFESKAVREG